LGSGVHLLSANGSYRLERPISRRPRQFSREESLKRNQAGRHPAPRPSLPSSAAGFTLLEALIVVAIGIIMTAVAIPVISTAWANMRINSSVADFTAALNTSRYQAIKNSQIYTMAITAPGNTYVLTDISATPPSAAPAVALPPYITINSGGGVYTYTLCPNGMVYGAGGACPGPVPPALLFKYQNRQINISVSEVGNVSTTIIH
jgi:type II secretory pathway pseudopilin PulG